MPHSPISLALFLYPLQWVIFWKSNSSGLFSIFNWVIFNIIRYFMIKIDLILFKLFILSLQFLYIYSFLYYNSRRIIWFVTCGTAWPLLPRRRSTPRDRVYLLEHARSLPHGGAWTHTHKKRHTINRHNKKKLVGKKNGKILAARGTWTLVSYARRLYPSYEDEDAHMHVCHRRRWRMHTYLI